MHNLKELKIWNKAIALATDIYKITEELPKHELYGIVSQMRRSSVSISSNIAEGAGRNSDKEFVCFLAIANGSSYELQSQLTIANNLGYLSENDLEGLMSQVEEIQKMNYVFQKTLKNKVSAN